MLAIIQNDAKVPAGLYDDELRRRGIAHRMVRAYRGEVPPAPGEADALLVLGGYMSVQDTDRYPFLTPLRQALHDWSAAGRPLLGICLGGQLLAAALGGAVHCDTRGELGLTEIDLTPAGRDDPLFQGVASPLLSMQWHNDSFDLPPGATLLASTAICPGQAFRVGRHTYGLQFHPELTPQIVADWSRRRQLDDAILQAFQAQSETYQCASLQVLANFLKLAGL